MRTRNFIMYALGSFSGKRSHILNSVTLSFDLIYEGLDVVIRCVLYQHLLYLPN